MSTTDADAPAAPHSKPVGLKIPLKKNRRAINDAKAADEYAAVRDGDGDDAAIPFKISIKKSQKNRRKPSATPEVDSAGPDATHTVTDQGKSKHECEEEGELEGAVARDDNKSLPPLRDYQQRLLRETEAAIQEQRGKPRPSKRETKPAQTHARGPGAAEGGKDRGVLVYLPTGGGKTRVATELIVNEVRRGGRALFVVNRCGPRHTELCRAEQLQPAILLHTHEG